MNHHKRHLEDTLMNLGRHKLPVGLGLVLLSALLAWLHYYLFNDIQKISNYFFLHLAFLPMHALILGLFLEELIALREKYHRRRKLHLYLGVFFRQLGVETLSVMHAACRNRDEVDQIITVEKTWKHRDFLKAVAALEAFRPGMDQQSPYFAQLIKHISSNDEQLVSMIQNPLMLEFEELYYCLVALEHIVEEAQFHGAEGQMSKGALAHLARDAGKAMIMLLKLWLGYLEFLKNEHPVLFSYQVGLHNTIEPIMLDEAD